MTVLTFQQALDASQPKRHLILGNGFSIALKPNIFTYNSLYENADFSNIPHANQLFDALNTRDFELVIKLLMEMTKILGIYSADASINQQIKKDIDKLKSILVETIAANHPDRPDTITPEQYAACRLFLYNFGHIYTLNYDTLLYWALMQDTVDVLEFKPDDGFRSSEDENATYVSWQSHHSSKQYYLHGALHLFDTGDEIIKYTWSRTDIPIIDQIRIALEQGKYPIFVSEGDSASKKQKILHNGYLHKALRSLSSVTGSIFIFGHSLDDNDAHIFHEIVKNKGIKSLFVSLHGNSDNKPNKQIKQKAENLVAERDSLFPSNPLAISFYQSESAKVWG